MPIRLDTSRTDAFATRWRRAIGPAQIVLTCDGGGVAQLRSSEGELLQRWPSPLAALDWLDGQRTKRAGRWVGFLSYDLGRFFEELPTRAADDLELPLFRFSWHAYSEQPLPLAWETPQPAGSVVGSNFTRAGYLRAVQQALDYIAAGDIFQVNLAQRFQVRCQSEPEVIYAHLQHQYPAHYAALLAYEDFALISNSPELFLRVWSDGSQRHIITRPIKGTRPRRPGLDQELLQSAKDAAELNMIIDLERNDLGRVCRIASVRVPETRIIEAHPTVFHGAATVSGELREDVTLADILRATFPGGSITGAPKIRAMEIIDELEPTRRGPYCGAIGYLDADGTLEFNIAIRTLIAIGREMYIPVGGGIVADSEPQAEYDETLAKAHAAFAVLGVA